MTGRISEKEFSRTAFLKGGGALIVGFGFAGTGLAGPALAAAPGTPLPIPVDQVDSYLTVQADNTATLFDSIMERGQGSRTSMLMIAAEELDLGMDQISHARLDSATTPSSGNAGGSQGVTIGGTYVRAAAAAAKQALLGLASTSLGVPVSGLSVDRGVVSGGGKSVTYGQLIGGKLFNITMPEKPQRILTTGWGPSTFVLRPGLEPGEPPSKPISEYRIVTTPVRRVDVPDMVTGKMVYSGDARVPGMLHGRVVRPRGQSALVNRRTNDVTATNYTRELALGGGRAPLSIDERSIAHLKGVQVVRVGSFVGVVAADEYEAVQAAAQLKVMWAEPAGSLPGNDHLAETLRETAGDTSTFLTENGNVQVGLTQPPGTALLSTWTGDVDASLTQAVKTISATYRTSYLVHGALGPHVAIADVTSTGATIIHQPGAVPNLAAAGVAAVLGIPPANVREIGFQGSSFYGRTSTDLDTPSAAALMSKAVGKPVRVQFMRWDEHGYDNYDPAEVIDVRAGIDAKGSIVAFDFVGHMQQDSLPAPAWLTGGVYRIPNRRVVRRLAPRLLAASLLRSPGDRGPAFATEQMIDELAHAAGMDPLEFRRQNMTGNDVWLEVLDAAAAAARWEPRRAASRLSDANVVTGRGFGFGTHVAGGGAQGRPGLDFTTLDSTTAAATVAHIEVNKRTGKIRAKHLYAAISPGLVVNPGRVADQVIGASTQGTSQTLIERVIFNRSNVTSLDWVTYPVIRFKDHPKVTPIVLQRPDRGTHGAGEEPVAAVFPAIANAFFDATGVRIREVPMTPAVVRRTLRGAGIGYFRPVSARTTS